MRLHIMYRDYLQVRGKLDGRFRQRHFTDLAHAERAATTILYHIRSILV